MRYRADHLIGIAFCIGALFFQSLSRGGEIVPRFPVERRIDRFGDPLPENAIARCGSQRLRSASFMPFAAISPPGKLIAVSGRKPRQIDLWDVVSGRRVRVLAGHNQTVEFFSFSPDGASMASGAVGDDVPVWHVATGRLLFRVPRDAPPGIRSTDFYSPSCFSHDGKFLAVGIFGYDVQLCEAGTGKQVRILRTPLVRIKNQPKAHKVALVDLRFSADDQSLIGVGECEQILVWDVETGRATIKNEADDDDDVSTGAFTLSADGTMAAGAYADFVRVRSVQTGKEIRRFDRQSCRDYCEAFGVAFSGDGMSLALETNADGPSIHQFKIRTGRKLAEFRGHGTLAHKMCFAADGSRLMACTEFRTHVWDTKTRKRLSYLKGHEAVLSVAFSPDGKTVASTGVCDVRLWNAQTGRQTHNLQHGTGVGFLADGKTFLTVNASDKTMHFWNIATGKLTRSRKLKSWDGNSPAIVFNRKSGSRQFGEGISNLASLSPDKQIVSYLAEASQVAFWNIRKDAFRLLHSVNPRANHSAHYRTHALSPGGTQVLCLEWTEDSGYRCVLFDVGTGKRLREWTASSGRIQSAIFSPDGKTIAVVTKRDVDKHFPIDIQLFDPRNGRQLRSVGSVEASEPLVMYGPSPMAFSPNSRFLAIGGGATIHLWDLKEGTRILQLPGHWGIVTTLEFSANDRLASGSTDSTVLIWDLKTFLQR